MAMAQYSVEEIDNVVERLVNIHHGFSRNAASSTLASCRSAVSKPSVNQP
jgi:hypothetical protein